MSVATLFLLIRIYGMAGSGKTRLAESLCGDHSFENCTKYSWTVYDTPGYGTLQHPTIFNVTNLFEPLDFAIIVIGPRVYTQDVEAFNHFKRENITTFIVRSKCDVFPCDGSDLLKMGMVYFPGSVVFDQPNSRVLEFMVDFIQRYNTIQV